MVNKRKLFYLSFLHFIYDGFLACFSLLLPFIVKDLGMNLTQAGFLGTILNSVGVFLALPAGYLAGRYGGPRVLISSLLIFGVAYFVTGLSHSYFLLFAAYSLAGVGFGLFHPVALALVSKESHADHRGKSLATFMASGDVGRVALAAGLTFFVVGVGWRNSAYMLSALAIVSFLGLFFFKNGGKSIPVQADSEHVPLSILLQNRRFLLATIAASVDAFASSSFFIFLPFLLLAKGIEPSLLGSFTAAFFVGTVLGKTILGWAIDAFGQKHIFVLAEVMMAVFIFCLLFTNNFVLIVLLSIILGSLTSGTAPVAETMISCTAEHHRNFEKCFAVSSTFVNIATAVAPVVYGFVSDKWGIQTAFFLSAFAAFVAIVPILVIPDNKLSKSYTLE